MRIRPVETSGLPMPFQRRGQGPVIVGSPDPLAWANKADGAKHAWDFIANAARWNGQYIGALANTPNWTFTRASTGYAQTSAGALTAFASGELRRTDKGVLIEGARTNKCTNYNAVIPALVTMTATDATFNSGVTNAVASGGDAGTLWGVVDDSAAIAAAGLSAAVTNGRVFKIDNSGGSAAAYITFGGTTGNTNTHTFSAYLRGSGGIRYGDNGGFGATATVTADYVRYSHADATVGSGAAFAIEAGAGEVVYCILNQMEDASFVSSPIPIAGASATRAADVLTVPVSGIDYPLSLYAEWEKNGDDSVNPYQRVIEVGRASATDRAVFYHRAVNNSSRLYATSGGAAQADMDVGTSALNTTRKMAGRFATNDFAASLGGAAVVYDTSGSVPATPQNVYFGHQPGGAYMLFGYLRRAALWTRALTDAELQAVTT